jgi:segregation and condensation protein A
MATFQITTEQFEGPIDALLQMIEKRKLPINDISLADITDDYIHFVQSLGDESLSSKTHFIFVASTLILIKSKSLLPKLELTEDEEGDIEELKRRIAVLQEYQNLALVLKTNFSSQRSYYYAKPARRIISFQPHEVINPGNLAEALGSVFKEVPEKKDNTKEAYVKIAVHIDEMMNSLEERLQQAVSMSFSSFIGDRTKNLTQEKEVRVHKVVGFLAMLELVKNGALGVLQEKNFTDIKIEQL